eukprot:692201-Heterocapsa_arctica.AAC.1
MVQTHLVQTRKRQRAWLSRDKDGGWRPRKKFRSSAYKYLLILENQLRAFGKSLGDFIQTAEPASSMSPLCRPRLSLAIDLGGRELVANIEMCPDPSHGVHNNINLSISRAGLQPHMHMSLIARNVQHGPYHEARRYEEVVKALDE